MPWTLDDVSGKTKAAVTPAQKRQWVSTANSVLERCLEGGESQSVCEGRAIRIANNAVKEGAFDAWFDQQTEETQGLVLAYIHGLKSALESERALRKEAQHHVREVASLLSEATKVDGGKTYTASDYAYVPDPDSPDTWKLRVSEYVGGRKQKTANMVGRAVAAIGPKGYRGRRAQIPAGDMGGVKAKLRRFWKQVNPDRDPEEMPSHIREMEAVAPLEGEFVALVERSVGEDGLVPLKLIAPGWGTSGYYGPGVLEQGARAFPKGTQMFWDHPTAEEEEARPEGSLRNLAGELAEDAYWDGSGIYGPGLYARAKVFSPFKDAIDELAPHMGVSIRALGRAEQGKAEGREGPLVTEISTARSVDFVTSPGAGGRVLELFEAARKGARGADDDKGGTEMEELKKLQEAFDALERKHDTLKQEKTDADTEIARLREAILLRQAKDKVGEMLAEFELPSMTEIRLVEALSKDPPLTEDGKLDEEALKKRVTEAVKAEVAYLEGVAGAGVIKGMGASGDTGGKEKDALVESFVFKFEQQGYSKEEALKLAKTAAEGR